MARPDETKDWEATLILRVSAKTPKEALRELRRQLIRIATRRRGSSTLEQSLRLTRPVVTKLTHR